MIYQAISDLLQYAKSHLGLRKEDTVYASNVLMEKLHLSDIKPCWTNEKRIAELDCPDSVIAPIVEYALANGVIEEGEEEFFSSDLLDVLSPRPSQVIDEFNVALANDPETAFDKLFDLGVKNDYVKLSAIRKNREWLAEKTKHQIEITINLSKPEKNNKQVAQMRNVSAGYPKCMLCKENLGYVGQGRTRRNMRTVPITLAGEQWFWQFSPYAYFYQHGIAINDKHTPMTVNTQTIRKVLDFVDIAPQYCLGSNAALPIVGGSILGHEHFQGGKWDFPMFKCGSLFDLECPVKGVDACVLDWYNSVVLLQGEVKEDVAKAGDLILEKWLTYFDSSVGILAKTDAQHNTLAPIAKKKDGKYQLFLQLRNNRQNEEHPDGIFHAHKEYHNIKSESIGLIEAMGRFILPGRLDRQLKEVEKFLTGENTEIAEDMQIHADMIKGLLEKHGNALSEKRAHEIVIAYVEDVCENILYNTAVFKQDEQGMSAFKKFLKKCDFLVK